MIGKMTRNLHSVRIIKVRKTRYISHLFITKLIFISKKEKKLVLCIVCKVYRNILAFSNLLVYELCL